MTLDWNAYRDQILATLGELGRLSPGTVRGYRELNRDQWLDAALAVATQACRICN